MEFGDHAEPAVLKNRSRKLQLSAANARGMRVSASPSWSAPVDKPRRVTSPDTYPQVRLVSYDRSWATLYTGMRLA